MTIAKQYKKLADDTNPNAWDFENAIEHEYVIEIDEIIDQRRWTTWHRLVYRFKDNICLEVIHGTGNTEYQENEEDIECHLVEPYEETVINYRRV